MIIVMATREREHIEHVIARVKELGYRPHLIEGVERTVVACTGDERGKFRLQALESLPGVDHVVPILKPFKLAGREAKHTDTVFHVGSAQMGGTKLCVIAGPCSVESRDQIRESARIVKEGGGAMLRGGAFKPRTSPYAFQGLEEEGLQYLREASDEAGLPFVTEVMTPEQAPIVEQYADMIQIGARNMQNFALLRAAGKSSKPVFLKRGMAATINEFLMSAEYVLSEGNQNVVLCERGIRTFETETRNTLDLSAVPVLNRLTHLPVFVDPSHGTGHWHLVEPMARAAVAAGADGLMIEMHPQPEEAMSDGAQSLKPKRFDQLMAGLAPFVEAMGKTL